MKSPTLVKGIRNFIVRFLLEKAHLRVQRVCPNPGWPEHKDRSTYQERHVNFRFDQQERVLDIGSGNHPLPYATVLLDKFTGVTVHRSESLRKDDRPLIVADVCNLPFKDKVFDFVYCSHLLEHVDDPVQASKEIIRIGRRGYIETPTFGKDTLFAWAQEMHKWHVVGISNVLCFFEYSARQLEGVRSSAWTNVILDGWYHPLQEAFYNNQDIFNVMFEWEDQFTVLAFYLDGSTRQSNAPEADHLERLYSKT